MTTNTELCRQNIITAATSAEGISVQASSSEHTSTAGTLKKTSTGGLSLNVLTATLDSVESELSRQMVSEQLWRSVL